MTATRRPKSTRTTKRARSGTINQKGSKDETVIEEEITTTQEVAEPVEVPKAEEFLTRSQLFDHLTHNLNDDSSLLQIDDVDLNYIVFHCKPLVLSTEAQLEEACEKEIQESKGKNKTKHGGRNSKSKRFDALNTID